MSEIKPHEQDHDVINVQRVFRVAIIYTIVAFASLGLAVFLIPRFPIWQVILMAVIAVISLGCDLAALVLIRRNQPAKALKVLYWTSLFTVPFNTLLFVNVTSFLAVMVIVVGLINVYYLFPDSWQQRRYIMGPVVAVVVMLIVEFINPHFRADLGNTSGNFGPVVIFFIVISVVAILIRQGWTGNIRVKLVTSFTLLALISVSIVGGVVYFSYRNQVRDDFRQRLVNMVSIAALQQNGDLHASIQNPGDEESDAYKQIQKINKAIVATEPEVAYLYTMRMDEQGQVQFFVDAGQPGDDDLAAVAEIYEDPTPLMIDNFPSIDHAFAEEEFFTDKWGTWLTAYAPFYNSSGEREGIIGIDIAAGTVIAQERDVLILIIGATVGALIIVTLMGLFLGNLFIRPITNLAATAQQVADGDLSARAEIETADEIGDLATVFNEMTSQLQETLETLEGQVEERTRALETSTEVSRRLSTILDQDQLVREVVEQLRSAFGYYHAHIYLFDERKRTLEMVGGTGEAGRTMLAQDHKIETGQGLVGRAAKDNTVVLIPDVTQAEGWLPNPLLPDTKAEVAVPIAIGGDILGVLDVQHNVADGLNSQDADLIQAIANQVAIAVQNAQAYTRTQQQATQEARVTAISQRIQSATSIDDVLQIAVSELGQVLEAQRSSVELQVRSQSDNGRD